jgi:hypothetical protein
MCKHIDRGKNIVMSETDFRKQLLLNEFKTLSKGKSKEELLPLVFALSQKAKQAGIQFTKQDCEMIYKQIVPGGNIMIH